LTCVMAAALLSGLLLAGCNKEDAKGFPKVDYNKDGKIIFEELIVVFPDLTVDEFLAADADHNGVLNESEYNRFRQARDAGKKLDASSAPLAPAGGEPAKAAEPAKPAEPAKAAEPAKPTEPAKAAEPAKSAEPAPTAAAQTPAATPPASPAPASPAAEVVETVVAEVAATPAAPGPAKTYTVARGDNLLRIAKKFGITTKELMAANGMKDADRVDAGRVLTIPAPAQDGAAATGEKSDAVKPAVAAFVADYFVKSSAADASELVALYGETVDYYKKGKTGSDAVRQDKTAYFQRWPERSYKSGAPRVTELSGGELKVAIPVDYVVKRGDKTARGKATFTLLLRPAGGSYRIVGEQSAVESK